MLSENPPDRPGVRFSCSPRIFDRSDVRSSASDTAPASLFATVKSTSPAGTRAGLGAQPDGVRSIVTAVVLAGVLPAGPCPLEQPAAVRATAVSAASTVAGAARAPRRRV